LPQLERAEGAVEEGSDPMLENNNEEADDYEDEREKERLADENAESYPVAGTKQVLYVNLYRVTRHYGGPEEGGWWYNAGEPLASVPIPGIWRSEEMPDAEVPPEWKPDPQLLPLVMDEYVREKERLMDLFIFEKWGSIYSMRGGADIEVRSEEFVARSWPERRPHYE
jgi:hypothetical protein